MLSINKVDPFIGLKHSKKKIVYSFKGYENTLYFEIMCLLMQSANRPFININDTIKKVSKANKQKAINKFIDVKLLLPTKDKNIFRVSKSFMFYGEEIREIN